MSRDDIIWMLQEMSQRLAKVEALIYRHGSILDERTNHEARITELEITERVRKATPKPESRKAREISWTTVWVLGCLTLYVINFWYATPETKQHIIEHTNKKLLDLGIK